MPVYYLTPGVYRRPQPVETARIQLVRTDVAGFVGFAERGPLPRPDATPDEAREAAVRLTSWGQFRAIFGGFVPYGYLAYAVRAFFANGGAACYVVRVAALRPGNGFPPPCKASVVLPAMPGSSGEPSTIAAFLVTARSAGSWGNRIKLAITPHKPGEFALRVTLMPGRDPSAPVEEEFYNRLSVAEGPFFVLDRVNDFSNLITLEAAAPGPIPPVSFVGGGRMSAGMLQDMAMNQPDAFNVAHAVLLQGGEDGLGGLTTHDFTGGVDAWCGLRILEEIDEVSILCAPDAVFEPAQASPVQVDAPADQSAESSPAEQSAGKTGDQKATARSIDPVSIYCAMIDQCERLHDRVALLDYPRNTKKFNHLLAWKEQFVSRFAAIYYPWLDVADPLAVEGALRRVPTAGHIAGLYARIDNQFGVHRPPANAELEFVTDVADRLTDLGQQRLNPYGINAIRSFPKRGVRVWGVRSLAGPADTDWHFIHARRLMSMIEESLSKSMQWAVFEPNDFTLRQTLVHSISVFLGAVWRAGGLAGSRPSQGFYVKCDDTNNPPAVIDAGKIICEVGVAITVPMEFLVFEIRQNPGTIEISES
jgi:hypothetical protein